MNSQDAYNTQDKDDIDNIRRVNSRDRYSRLSACYQHDDLTINNRKQSQEITPQNKRHMSINYFYQTFQKPYGGIGLNVKLMNTEKGNDYNIILIDRDRKLSCSSHNDIGIDQPKEENKDIKEEDNDDDNNNNQNEDCDVVSSMHSSMKTIKARNAISSFDVKFMGGLVSLPSSEKNNQGRIDNSNSNENKSLIKVSNVKELKMLYNRDTSSSLEQHLNNTSLPYMGNQISTREDQVPLINSNHSTIDKDNDCLIKKTSSSGLITEKHEDENITNSNTKHKQRLPSINPKPKQKINTKPLSINPIPMSDKEQNNTYDTEFTFSPNQERRYKGKDIIAKRNFFQMRYLNQNLRNIPKISNKNDDKDKKRDYNDNQKNFYFYIDNKNVMKYTSLFFIKLEAAIFQFNTRQYEKAYRSLIDDNIIFNIDELCELLLLVQGFDKGIIGEFLAGEKSPNEKHHLTKAFISKLDFHNEEFMPSFRLLLSLFILPKENKEIIYEYFSACFFNDNLDKYNKYKNQNYVQSLCLLAIDANTILNKQSKGIKREDFLIHYPNIDKDISSIIFDDIQRKRLISIKDESHNEEMYKKVFNKLNPTTIGINGNSAMTSVNPSKNNNNDNTIIPIKTNQCSPDGAKIPTENVKLNQSDLLALLKRGESFKVKKSNHTKIEDKIINLSEDEQTINIISLGCSCSFNSTKRLSLDSISNIYKGSPIITNNDNDNYCSIVTKANRTYELFNSSTKVIMKWYQGLYSLVKRKQPFKENKRNSVVCKNEEGNDNSKANDYISMYWSDIVNNWIDYREVLMIKNKRNISFNRKPSAFLPQPLPSIINNTLKLNKEQIINLWTLGLPTWIRSSLWKLSLIDQLDICENLIANYQMIIKAEIQSIAEDMASIELIETIKEINADVGKLYKKFQVYITVKEETFKDDLYIMIRSFMLYRPDIILYSKQIAYMATMFYLNSNNSYYEAFILMCNFIVPNCFFKLMIQDEFFAREFENFFDVLLSKYACKVHKHFSTFGLNSSVFFSKWVGYLFASVFQYDTLMRIWDNFILKGNIFIFEVALAIITIQEKDFLDSSVSNMLECLKHFPKKYSEKELFEMINKRNIVEDYQRHFDMYEIAKEKGALSLYL